MRTLSSRVRYGIGFVVSAIAACFGMPIAIGATLTVETPVTMWDKVEQRLNNATPLAQMQFRAFKSWAMQHLGQLSLQLIDIADLTDDVNPLDGTVRIRAIYLKKQGTATDAYYNIFDDATNDATAGDARLSLLLAEASKEVLCFYPDGLPLTDGLVHGSYTALIGSNGSTPTTTGDGPNGFVLVSA